MPSIENNDPSVAATGDRQTIAHMNEWNIQTRAHHCQACGKGFEDKAAYHTLLFDDQEEGHVRRDICGSCWKSEFEEGAGQDGTYISYWQGIYEAPPPAAPEPIQKENAESLLRKLIERNDPTFAAAGFILAVMLERKRQLKIKEQFHKEGQRVFVYEHPQTGDLFTITDPALHLNQLEAVQSQVSDLLEFGLNGAGEIAYPPEPEPASVDAAFDDLPEGEDAAPEPNPAEAARETPVKESQDDSEAVAENYESSDEFEDDEDDEDDDDFDEEAENEDEIVAEGEADSDKKSISR